MLTVFLDGEDVHIGRVSAQANELAILHLVAHATELEGGNLHEALLVCLEERLSVIQVPEIADR